MNRKISACWVLKISAKAKQYIWVNGADVKKCYYRREQSGKAFGAATFEQRPEGNEEGTDYWEKRHQPPMSMCTGPAE